jgi:hypothetical protein
MDFVNKETYVFSGSGNLFINKILGSNFHTSEKGSKEKNLLSLFKYLWIKHQGHELETFPP